MEQLQKLVNDMIKEIPKLALEKRLAQKLEEVSIKVDEETISKAAQHVLSGNPDIFHLSGHEDVNIEITDGDIEHVLKVSEKFYTEQLAGILDNLGDKIAADLIKLLGKRWPEEFAAHQTDMDEFKERLEQRWGRGLGKLRMLLAIVREWGQGAFDRKHKSSGGKLSHYDDVMLRLHVRACQIVSEVIILLENGYADGAMARWRTLHEVTVVAAIIAKFGEEIAERYVYYQVVESLSALKAYERNHVALGFKPPGKKESTNLRKAHAKILQRFGKKFDEEYGWAAFHLKAKEKERITFARLEAEAGDERMRSPYKMASYNVHASPKGVYFKLGSLKGSPVLLAGASNAGLTEPAQNAAVSLAEITLLAIGGSPIFDDVVAGKIAAKLASIIPLEFFKADKKLHHDEKKLSKPT